MIRRLIGLLVLLVSSRLLGIKLQPRIDSPEGALGPRTCGDTPSRKPEPQDFRVLAHDTHYLYACYLSTSAEKALRTGAVKVLTSGLARLVLMPDGRCSWLSKGAVRSGSISEMDLADSPGKTRLILPVKLEQELRGPVSRAAIRRSAERDLFAKSPFPEPYITILLHQIRLILKDGETLTLTPTIKLFQSGIILLTFSLSESSELDLATFVDRRVNLGQVNVSAIEAQPAFTYLLFDALIGEGARFRDRLAVRRERATVKEAYPIQVGDNNREYVRVEGSNQSSLTGTALEIVRALAYSLGRRRSGLPYLLLGEPHEPRWTGFWQASPHVHLRGFSDQRTSAQEIETLHARTFHHILARSSPGSGVLSSQLLPQNLRAFDDYLLYINRALILWVYAGLEEQPIIDGTKEHPLWSPITHHQVKGDLIEYATILYRSIIHELEEETSPDRVMSIWQRATELEMLLLDAGKYGEIQSMIREGLQAKGFGSLRDLTANVFILRERATILAETRRLGSLGAVLTGVLGVLALPQLVHFIHTTALPMFGWGDIGYHASIVLSVAPGIALPTFLYVFFLLLSRRLRWIKWTTAPRRR